jgi:hypothetical protein
LFYRLSRKTAERVRLTTQLIFLVNDVANEIAKQVDPITSVKVKGVGVLRVEVWRSHLETRKVLVFDGPRTKEDEGAKQAMSAPELLSVLTWNRHQGSFLAEIC